MQYKTQYGTIFAVKKHNGAPAIMCRAEHSETWSLSSMIAPYTPGAWTAEELQAQLDNWAAVKGWQPVEEPASVEPPRPRPGDVYRSPKSGQLYKIGELTNGKKTCYLTMRSNAQGGTWVPVNSSVYPKLSDAQGEFEAWIRTEHLEPVAPTGDAAATTDGSAAVSTAGTTTTSASGEGARNSPNSPSAPADTSAQSPKAADAVPSTRTTARAASGNGLLPAFDYTGLNVVTVDTLHLAENIIRSARQKYIVDLAGAVDMAHEELVRNSDGHNQHTEETFVAWCRSVGISKTTAYQLLQVQALITGATPEEQAVLEAASPSLLYAAAKPSAPAELVQAVKDGDITTHKQYQDLLARYNAEKSARQQAEQERDEAATHIQAARDMQIDTARERDTALRRAAEAEKQRDGARDALAAAKLRGDKLKAENDALKAQPVEAKVIDEEEVDRRAQARAAELTAPLREELEALRNRHPADLEEAEQAIRDAYDSAVYTGRVIESAWRSLCPLLPRMDADRRELALNQIVKIISTIQGECIQCL